MPSPSVAASRPRLGAADCPQLEPLGPRQGKRAAAYELFAPLYGWFTEGFDTVDVQEAKVLLEERGG